MFERARNTVQDSQAQDDAELLRKARAFDKNALTQVYQTYHDAIYRYIYHHIGDEQTAQDIASEVFRRFLHALSVGSGPTRLLSAWLYRVAHNLIVDELRRRSHRNHEPLDDALAETLQDDSESPEERAWSAIAESRLRETLLDLTPEQRQIIVLKFLEGMSNAQVARITGKTVGAIKALQHRGLESLRDKLEQGREHAGAKNVKRAVTALGSC